MADESAQPAGDRDAGPAPIMTAPVTVDVPLPPSVDESGTAERSAVAALSGLGTGGTGAVPGDEPTTDGAPGFVEPPEQIRAAAKVAPEHWIGYVDPAWQGEGTPPAWALVAQWRSDAAGAVVEYQENPEYRPSPAAMDWPEPTDPVDAAIQLAVTGYGPAEDVATTLCAAELAVFVQPDGQPLVAVSPDGKPVIPVFTSQAQLDVADRLAFVVMSAAELLAKFDEGIELYLNPAGPTPLRMAPEPILAALAGLSDDDGDDDENDENETENADHVIGDQVD